MIEFDKTAEATAYAKKKLRERNVTVHSVSSRYLPETATFRTRVALPGRPTDEDLSRVVGVLRDLGYADIDVHDLFRTVEAFSALTGTSHDPAAELARRALVEQMPDSYEADEVSAMPDSEAIAVAISCGLMEG